MDSINLTLFAEELLPLLQKYGYRGIVGFVKGGDSKPACFHLTVTGEPSGFYAVMQAHITEVLTALSGKPILESGTVHFVPKKSDNSEMPY